MLCNIWLPNSRFPFHTDCLLGPWWAATPTQTVLLQLCSFTFPICPYTSTLSSWEALTNSASLLYQFTQQHLKKYPPISSKVNTPFVECCHQALLEGTFWASKQIWYLHRWGIKSTSSSQVQQKQGLLFFPTDTPKHPSTSAPLLGLWRENSNYSNLHKIFEIFLSGDCQLVMKVKLKLKLWGRNWVIYFNTCNSFQHFGIVGAVSINHELMPRQKNPKPISAMNTFQNIFRILCHIKVSENERAK